MPEISPYRVVAYVAMAAVLLLVGWNSLRSGSPVGGGALVGAQEASGEGQAAGAKGAGLKLSPGSGAPTEAAGSGAELQFGSGGRQITVDVSGEVRRPGVYEFQHGQRVIDAIRRAGGATRAAFPAAINRAALLADGQQVIVPARAPGAGVSGAGPGVSVGGAAGAAPDAPISLGTATQAQLEEIEGIGPVTAQSILEFRDSQGGISSVEELDQVSGIGPVTMEALKSRLQP
jgi:competence protein ComEA